MTFYCCNIGSNQDGEARSTLYRYRFIDISQLSTFYILKNTEHDCFFQKFII